MVGRVGKTKTKVEHIGILGLESRVQNDLKIMDID